MGRTVAGLLFLLALVAMASPAAAQLPCFEAPLPTVVPATGVESAVLQGGARLFLWRATCDASADRVGVLARAVPPGASNPLACAVSAFSFVIDGVTVNATADFPCPLKEPITTVVQRVCAEACPPPGPGTFAPDRQAVFALSGGTQALALAPAPTPPPPPTVEITRGGCGPCAAGQRLTVQAVVVSEVERVVEIWASLYNPNGSAGNLVVQEVELVEGETTIPILNTLVPKDIAAGAYHFEVRLLDPETGETVAVDRLRVERTNDALDAS
jgi:hypothetical protein